MRYGLGSLPNNARPMRNREWHHHPGDVVTRHSNAESWGPAATAIVGCRRYQHPVLKASARFRANKQPVWKELWIGEADGLLPHEQQSMARPILDLQPMVGKELKMMIQVSGILEWLSTAFQQAASASGVFTACHEVRNWAGQAVGLLRVVIRDGKCWLAGNSAWLVSILEAIGWTARFAVRHRPRLATLLGLAVSSVAVWGFTLLAAKEKLRQAKVAQIASMAPVDHAALCGVTVPAPPPAGGVVAQPLCTAMHATYDSRLVAYLKVYVCLHQRTQPMLMTLWGRAKIWAEANRIPDSCMQHMMAESIALAFGMSPNEVRAMLILSSGESEFGMRVFSSKGTHRLERSTIWSLLLGHCSIWEWVFGEPSLHVVAS